MKLPHWVFSCFSHKNRFGCGLKGYNTIYAISEGNRQKSASEIRAKINGYLDSRISLTTVKGRLEEKGMIGRIAVRKPLLWPVNKQKRLKFTQEHVDWTIDQWKSVLWTDE